MKKVLLLVAILGAFGGCKADLEVRKVQQGPAGDHVEGFRYYLGRPYVVVKAPILVCENIEVVECADVEVNVQVQPDDVPKFSSHVESVDSTVHAVSAPELHLLKQRFQESLLPSSMVQTASFEPPIQDTPAAPGTSSSGTADLAVPDAAETTAAPKTSLGNIEIIYLPDFEEEYAVKNNNRLSKSAYSLSFRDGWELVAVNGEFDSSVVAIEILNTIETAIGAAKTVATASFEREKAEFEASQPKSGSDNKVNLEGMENRDRRQVRVVQKSTKTFLKPGVYRINKPCEMGGQFIDHGSMLANMGLQTITTVSYLPAPKYSVGKLVMPLAKPAVPPFNN